MKRSCAALLALAVVPVLTPSVQAADPVGSSEVVLPYVYDAPTPSNSRIEAFTPPLGARSTFATTPSTEAGGLDFPSVSRGGDRIVYSEIVDPTLGYRVRTIVRDVGGAVVRVLPGSRDPVISPDGTRIVTTGAGELRSQLVSGGPQTDITPVGGGFSIQFLTNDLLLVGQGGPDDLVPASYVTLSLSTGHVTPVTGFPRHTQQISFDRVLSRVVWPQGGLVIAPVTLSGNTLTIGTPQQLTTLPTSFTSDQHPAFSRSDDQVYFIRSTASIQSPTLAESDVYAVPAAGGAVTPLGPVTPGPSELESNVIVGARETTPPAAPSVGSATLSGTSATIPYALQVDPTASLVRFTRTSPGLPTRTGQVIEPNPIIDTGLIVGHTYTYALQAVDRSGNVGPVTSLSLVATAPPAISVPDPTSTGSTSTSFPVSLAATGNRADTRYAVNQREASGKTIFYRWLSQKTGPTGATFGSPAAPGQTATISTAGRSYAFMAQALDAYGNATVQVLSKLAVVPFDQTRAALSGSTITVARPGAYGGTTTFLRAAGAAATTRLVGDRFQVVGERGPTTGQFDVFLNGVRQARVDTRTPFRQPRQVLWSKAFSLNRDQVLTVRAVGTPGRPTVVLDAFASRRAVDTDASLSSGRVLARNQGLTSQDGRYRAVLQLSDGNFVIYAPTGRAIFATGVAASRLAVGLDGNVVAYDAANRPVFQTRTGGNGPSTLIMQNDGNLVLYRHRDGRPTWSSRSGRTY